MRGLLSVLPSATGRRLANDLERRLRGTNQRHKARLPESQLEQFTRRAVNRGYQGVVLGHFHTEICRPIGDGKLWILPDWRQGRRYLRFGSDGQGRFETYRSAA